MDNKEIGKLEIKEMKLFYENHCTSCNKNCWSKCYSTCEHRKDITIYKTLDELVEEYIETNVFLSEYEIESIKECSMVIEDILPSGSYTELEDGRIIKH